MKLLVPVDGSIASVNAVKKAIEIAKKDNASIKLISVINHDESRKYKRNENLWRQVDGSSIEGRDTSIDHEEADKKVKENAMDLLDSIVAELDFDDIKVEKEVLVGEPYEKILETVENEKFDMIVIANRGFSKIKSFFLGSVAHRVISESPCPVLVVHTDFES
ncbi:MAG: universal stress protein [Mobilitalea sp.]